MKVFFLFVKGYTVYRQFEMFGSFDHGFGAAGEKGFQPQPQSGFKSVFLTYLSIQKSGKIKIKQNVTFNYLK